MAGDDELLPAPLRGRYREVERLGEGSAGLVLAARDVELDRPVAIKLLKADASTSPEWRRRFLAEAHLTAKVRSPHVAEVYDAGEADGAAWLVLELLPGGSLADRLRAAGGRLPVPEALEFFAQVLEGLAAAHRAGIVHRDLKTENVLLGADGLARVADFGLARDLEAASATRTGTIMGTVAAMAPEQMAGGSADPRWDVYAAGVLVWELIAGRGPFPGGDFAELQRMKQRGPAAGLRAEGFPVPPAIDALILACLAPAPARRPAHAGAVLERFRGPAPGSPVEARPTVLPGSKGSAGTMLAGAPRTPRPIGPLAGGAVLACLLLGGWLALTRAPPPAPAPPPPPEDRVAPLEEPVRRLAAAAEADPVVEAFLQLGSSTDRAARAESWEAARGVLASRLGRLPEDLARLDPAAIAARPRLVDGLARLRLLAELVDRRRPEDRPSPGLVDGTALGPALSVALAAGSEPALIHPWAPTEVWHKDSLAALEAGGRRWTTVRSYAELMHKGKAGATRLKVLDWSGVHFTSLPESGAVGTVGSLALEETYDRVVDVPARARVILVPNRGEDLVLALATSHCGIEDVFRLTLEGEADPPLVLVWSPTRDQAEYDQGRRQGHRLVFSRALAPGGVRSLTFEAVGVQCFGRSGSTVDLHEVFQRLRASGD